MRKVPLFRTVMVTTAFIVSLSFPLSAQYASQSHSVATSSPHVDYTSIVFGTKLSEADKIKAYLNGRERNTRIAEAVDEAGVKVAKALEAGDFGKVFRFDNMSKPMKKGYSGIGTIATGPISESRTRVMVEVWWKSNGKIDYSKPITMIGLPNKNDTDMKVILGTSTVDYSKFWLVILDFGESIKTTSPSVVPAGQDNGVPSTLKGYKDLDDQALARLETNMDSYFD